MSIDELRAALRRHVNDHAIALRPCARFLEKEIDDGDRRTIDELRSILLKTLSRCVNAGVYFEKEWSERLGEAHGTLVRVRDGFIRSLPRANSTVEQVRAWVKETAPALVKELLKDLDKLSDALTNGLDKAPVTDDRSEGNGRGKETANE